MNKEQAEELAIKKYPEYAIGGTDNRYVIAKKRKAYAEGLVDGSVKSIKWVTGEYERLWEWANNPDRVRSIPMYVDYSYSKEDGTKFRDICHLKNIDFGFGARGIGYSSYSIYMQDDIVYGKERFLNDCKALNVEWLDESSPSHSYSEELKTAELKAAVESAIATFEWLGMIGGKGLIEHERMREFIAKYKPLIDGK